MTAARASKVTPPPPITLDELLARDGDVTKRTKVKGETRPFAWLVDPRTKRPSVLAFDLAKAGAWAYLSDTRRAFGRIDADEARIDSTWLTKLREIVSSACVWALEGNGTLPLVVVEDTNLGSAKDTPWSYADITRYGAGLASVCAMRGVPMVRIQASVWQSRLLGKVWRKQGKQLSMRVAQQRFGVASITTDDVADAANLATYVRGGR